jgi:hypothetical protein
VKADWRPSESGREVCGYRITPSGRRQLEAEVAEYPRKTRAIDLLIATLLWQVLREGGLITTIGIGIGLLLAMAAGQFLYGVRNIDPVVLVTAPLILIAASLLASYIPARRATRVDPRVALRSE